MSYGGSTYGGSSYSGGGSPPPVGDITETALTDDDLASNVVLSAEFDETALTDDTAVITRETNFIEDAATADTLSSNVELDRALGEGAATADTVAPVPPGAISETAVTFDTLSAHLSLHHGFTETAQTADTLSSLLVKSVSFMAITVVVPNIAAHSTPTPPAPVPGEFGLHDYEVIVCDKWGVAQGQITSAVPTEIEWVLDQIGEALIDCFILDSSLVELLPIDSFPGAREIQIWRDQALIWWGWPTSASFDAKQVHLSCAGLLYPFSVRNFGPITVNYLKNPQFEAPSTGPGNIPQWIVDGVAAYIINPTSGAQWPILLGNQALLLRQGDAGVDTFVYQEVSVDGGEQGLFYDLSAWVYPLGTGAPGVVEPAFGQNGLYVQFTPTGDLMPTDVEMQQITVNTPAQTWTRLETGIDIPPNTTGVIQIRLYAPQGDTVWDAVNLSVEESIGGSPTGSGTDAATIIDIVTKYAQDPTKGKSDLAIAPSPSVPTPINAPVGVDLVRIYQFSDNSGVLDALNEYPTIAACDFEVRWDDTGHFRWLQTYGPAKGVIKYNFPLEMNVDAVTDLQGTVDGTQTVTAARVLGQGSTGSSEDLAYAAFPSFVGGRVAGDGVVTLGSNHITSATLAFTADDVGEGIYVLFPFGTIPICSTIESVISPTEITFTNPSGLLAQGNVVQAIVGVGGVITDNVASALNDLPIGTLSGTAQTTLLSQLTAEFLPTARQRADGPDGLFGQVEVGDIIPVSFQYGWLNIGPILMRIGSLTLYPPTEELELQLINVPLGTAPYGG